MSKNAFETLKDYCEKCLEPEEYKIVPETSSFLPTIYFTSGCDIIFHCFFPNGIFSNSGCLDYDEEMNEHIKEAESEGKYEEN